MSPTSFSRRLLAWQAQHGRRGLPWQGSRDPYRVWLSEIMLQQTQVATVIPYYRRFLAHFPDVQALAAASLSEVMPLWAGLGYYARARHLHRCAQAVVGQHGGEFPRPVDALAALPGIGRSTAAAIAAFCFDARAPILDGNVKRVLARHFGVEGFPGAAPVEQRLWQIAQRLLPPAASMPAYTQAVMDLGATICTRRAPRCADCPVRGSCVARRTGRTAELPAARPARVQRVESAVMLLAVQRGRVLLERRPERGIWGGLLSLPQFARPAALRVAAATLAPAAVPEALPPRQHAFTHFTLRFTPYRLPVQRVRAVLPDTLWLPWRELENAALPAPIRTLLREQATEVPRAASGIG